MGFFKRDNEAAELDRWVKARVQDHLPLLTKRKELWDLPANLEEGEQPELFTTGSFQSIHTVLVVLTDRRIIFFERGLLSVFESVDPAEIKSAVLEKGRTGMVLRFSYGADINCKLSGLNPEHAEELLTAIQTRSRLLSEDTGRSKTDWSLDQLVKLGQLRDAGVLSEAEFEAQKAKILQSMP
jgi:putative oligomerization/nucleic acid binding protein/PH (Pleckstrin Homology) domain-containing protein